MKKDDVLITSQQVIVLTGLNHIELFRLSLKGELLQEKSNPSLWRLSGVMVWKSNQQGNKTIN
ncbi:hypothetical protein QJU96_04560 [Pasteurella skyensis]|uniref:Uncharacterized protein n=1 Tax=Phocoenobacter skyensis TaxID=97481 RepID=A0AAJ6ND38_9PAST|nr:hypothetical protein [Pasteurella skyensis]MDP8170560.1 hypothetical protein [Pasteurella skyensis]MDP8174613.1 hypothetical protein [Pasteurella skyensis]